MKARIQELVIGDVRDGCKRLNASHSHFLRQFRAETADSSLVTRLIHVD